MTAEEIKNEIRVALDGVSEVSEKTSKGDCGTVLDEDYSVLWTVKDVSNKAHIPLEPNLTAYCFKEVLGFDVRRHIAEKVDYVIPFDYKGTHAVISHFKLSYELRMNPLLVEEFLEALETVRTLIEELFILIAEDSLSKDEFSMKNDAPWYLSKIEFYQSRIEALQAESIRVRKESEGQYDVVPCGGGKKYTLKNQELINELSIEMLYDIEAYIDTFYATIEHILTILFPLVAAPTGSFYSDCLRQTRWTWKRKIESVCGNSIPSEIVERLSMIKEVYRNHNAHGSFSREMMAYIAIPHFGRYPIYIGKTYLKGLLNDEEQTVTYEKYLEIDETFRSFIDNLDMTFPIPMMFVRSGLPIPANNINSDMRGITNDTDAQNYIDRRWFEIYNQQNMDW